jgi:hypothetical protein
MSVQSSWDRWKLAPREDAAPMMLAYAVSWRRENSKMKVVLDYFAPVAN